MRDTPVVLLVEDDRADQELARRAFEVAAIPVDLRVVDDGEQALDYLMDRGRFVGGARAPKADLVLLDLNMPRIDGYGVIAALRGDDRFRELPVVVMSTSANVDDVNRSYHMGCSTFITKPPDLDGYVRVIGELVRYWFELVSVPGGRSTDA